MEATEAIGRLWRAFPDLARAPGAGNAAFVGFVSRAWRPIPLVHQPVGGADVGARIAMGPAWAGSVQSSGA